MPFLGNLAFDLMLLLFQDITLLQGLSPCLQVLLLVLQLADTRLTPADFLGQFLHHTSPFGVR